MVDNSQESKIENRMKELLEELVKIATLELKLYGHGNYTGSYLVVANEIDKLPISYDRKYQGLLSLSLFDPSIGYELHKAGLNTSPIHDGACIFDEGGELKILSAYTAFQGPREFPTNSYGKRYTAALFASMHPYVICTGIVETHEKNGPYEGILFKNGEVIWRYVYKEETSVSPIGLEEMRRNE